MNRVSDSAGSGSHRFRLPVPVQVLVFPALRDPSPGIFGSEIGLRPGAADLGILGKFAFSADFLFFLGFSRFFPIF